ncbi:MAG: adenylate kinase [Candidatus Cloacimonetes bacterium]|nr:adenylate kinase [Candidatus Cloacimonadota bacterium]
MSRPLDLDRVNVIGTSCCGKTTFTRSLGRILGRTPTELDNLYWLPDWEPRLLSDFRARVDAVTREPRWLVDGNYSPVRDLVWPRATLLIWLDHSFPRVFARSLRRTVTRCATGEELFAGNRENWRLAFFSRDSILWWVIRTWKRRRREFERLTAQQDCPPCLRFRTPGEARRWLEALEASTHANHPE